MINKYKKEINGFSIVELVVVIVVIGILATITYISYSSVQSKTYDTRVLSDIDTMDAIQTRYGLKHSTGGEAYYSGIDTDNDLGFTPNAGTVIDVVANSTDYCIRGYSLRGTKNSIYNSYTKESSTGSCDILDPSAQAIADYSGNKIWLRLAVGATHTCGISSEYKAYCWGNNGSGQLGNNSTTNSSSPVAVDTTGVLNGLTIKAISAGGNNTCVIASDQQIYCWGDNSNGQLGNNSTTNSSSPVAVTTSGVLSGLTIKTISVGNGYACAIASNSKVYCWGNDGGGQLGDGHSSTSYYVPVAVITSGVLNGLTIKALSATAQSNACAIASDNKAYCWGSNNFGQLGNNSTTDSSTPVAVTTSGVLNGLTIKTISVGGWSTCAVASDNKAYCWGSNIDGKLGNNTTTDSSIPVAVDTSGVLNNKAIYTVASGSYSTCALTTDNNVSCWGENSSGQLGNNTTTRSLIPVSITNSGDLNGKTVKNVYASGYRHACALDTDGKAYCWGYNSYGQLGIGSTSSKNVPTAVNVIP